MILAGMTTPSGPSAPVGLPAIAQCARAKHLHLVEILDRIEAAVHVAVECRIADRHFRFVAGRHQHRAEFVGQRHEQRSAHAALHILFGDVARSPGEERREHGFETARRQARSAGCRSETPSALAQSAASSSDDLRRIAIGHHDAVDARRPQRIDRQRRGERRIDAARQPHDDAGKAVLLDIFAQPQHAGGVIGLVPFFDHGARRLDADPAVCADAARRSWRRIRRNAGNCDGERAIGVEREGGAVEDEFVLAADLVQIDQRQPALDARARPRSAGVRPACRANRASRSGTIEISAPVSARHSTTSSPQMSSQIGTPMRTPRKTIGPGGARGEDALLVEDAVIRQIDLEAHGFDPAVVEQGIGIVAAAVLGPGQADEHRRAAVGGRRARSPRGGAAGLLEGRLQHQILGRIAGEKSSEKMTRSAPIAAASARAARTAAALPAMSPTVQPIWARTMTRRSVGVMRGCSPSRHRS